MKTEIKQGDIVVHKNDDLPMNVQKVEASKAHCIWFDHNNNTMTRKFDCAELEIYDPWITGLWEDGCKHV